MVTKKEANKGFTLIEILVVIGLIAILAAIVLIAINPGRQFAQARNSQRESNVNTILNAIGQRLADNKGLYPAVTGCEAITTATSTIATTGVKAGLATALIDESCLVGTYIPSQLPFDPSNGAWNTAADYNTGYNVSVDSNGRYTVCAPSHQETAITGSAMYCLTR